MHFPFLFKKKSWQRFFLGVFFGAVISYCIILYMYGDMYETLVEKNVEISSQLEDVKNQNEALTEEKDKINQQSKKALTIQTIDIDITNSKKLKIDKLLETRITDMIKKDIHDLIGKDVSSVGENYHLLIKSIENKQIDHDDFSYTFKVKHLILSQNVKILLKADVES